VRDHHFDLAYEAFVADPEVADFMRQANPDAQREMADRLMEAIDRGIWRPRSNSAGDTLRRLMRGEPG
jgi:cobaltochelatase CobN